MRKIRFRAKSIKDSNRWEWVYGWFTSDFTTQPSATHLILTDNGVIYNVDPLTLGQYTGLKDKKRTKEYPEGQEIYEGDIFKCLDEFGVEAVRKVIFKQGTFCDNYEDTGIWKFADEGWNRGHNYIEIIGNIYDNTNLLKEENNE